MMSVFTRVENFDASGRKFADILYYGKQPVKGTEVVLDDLGELRATIPFSHGKKHGLEKVYSDGVLTMEIRWVKGKQGGEQTIYDDFGLVIETSQWREGKKHGTEYFYRRNGTAWKSIEWRWGKKHGEENEYFYSGELKSSKIWERNHRVGLTKYYDLDGYKVSWFKHIVQELVKLF